MGVVNTKTVTGRRDLHFATIDDCISDVHKIMAADLEGRHSPLGNWSPGQILSHVAAWIDYGYEGFPVKALPWPVRLIMRKLKLPKMLAHGMEPGVKIPGVAGGTTGADDVPVSEAGPRLIAALRRLASDEPAKFPSPAFGELSNEDRRRLMVRHAEMHMSFLRLGRPVHDRP